MSAIKLLEEAREHIKSCVLTGWQDTDLLARIDALLKSGGWIPVAERLPEKPDVYLTVQFMRDSAEKSRAFREFKDGVWDDPFLILGTSAASDVTHWQPLPPLPEAKQ